MAGNFGLSQRERQALDQLRGTGLSKRLSLQELTGRGINVIDADASYASLVHKVCESDLIVDIFRIEHFFCWLISFSFLFLGLFFFRGQNPSNTRRLD